MAASCSRVSSRTKGRNPIFLLRALAPVLLALHGCAAIELAPHASKRVLLLRHGHTEMNAYLARVPWDAPHFRDPMLIDTRLTAEGRAQAERAAHSLVGRSDVELVVCSPLTRALATCELAFARDGSRVPTIVVPLAAERRWHGSDLGRPRPLLEAEFPGAHIDWSLLPPEGSWGYPEVAAAVDSSGGSAGIFEEAEAEFVERMRGLHGWLAARPERTIAVVSHWGVIHALSGKQVENCALLECELHELTPGAHLLGD